MKKFAPYIFIAIIILVGLFSRAIPVRTAEAAGACYTFDASPSIISDITDEGMCDDAPGQWSPTGTPPPAPTTTSTSATPQNAFEAEMMKKVCFSLRGGISASACVVQFFYVILFVLPSFMLWLAAHFFNVLISITLSSSMLNSAFVSSAWVIVRDLSNIFFILILLYIAIKIILDLGGHEAKKMIAHVVIMALLINFSMFVTQVVIDSSNVLALIFYNKLVVGKENPDGSITPTAYDPVTGEKDVSGGLMTAFDPTKLIQPEFFKAAEQITVPGFPAVPNEVPAGILIGVIVVAGAIMLFAAYAFFIAGLSFVGRLIELFVLIVFSPFAFMSFSIPILGRLEYIGWDAWSHRLIKTAFMAPIFMFMLYFIFKVVKANIFGDLVRPGTQGIIIRLLSIMIPAMVILVLLMKATEYAKKGSGHFGEMLIKGGKLGAGIALGAATGGVALAGSSLIGGQVASRLASNKFLNRTQNNKWGGWASRAVLKSADYGAQASFDVRKMPVVGKGYAALAKAGGIDLEKAKVIGLGSKEGGYEKRRAEKVRKRQQRADDLKVREDEKLKQDLNMYEQEKQGLLDMYGHDLEVLSGRIKSARDRAKDLAGRANREGATPEDKAAYETASNKVEELINHKKAVENGETFTETALTADPLAGPRTIVYQKAKGRDGNERSLAQLQEHYVPHAHHALASEETARKVGYAGRLDNKWMHPFSYRVNREASDKIRRKAKVPSKPKKSGGDHGHDDHGGGGHDDHGGGHGGGGAAPAAAAHPPAAPAAGHGPAPAAAGHGH